MRKELREVLEELGAWWESFSEGTRRLYIAIVASLPGADDLYSAFGPNITVNIPAVGWKETEILTKLLTTIQDAQDVRTITKCILYNEWPQDPESIPIIVHAKTGDIKLGPGLYADAAFGWDHIREIMADMVEEWLGDKELAEELRGEPPDDAGDEYEALDKLNEVTENGYWEFSEYGDGLVLIAEEEVENA